MRIKKLNYFYKIKQKLITTFEMINMDLISFYLKLKIEKNQAKKC